MEKLNLETELKNISGGNGNLNLNVNPREHIGKAVTADELVVGNEYIFIHHSCPDTYVGAFVKIYTNYRKVQIICIKDDSGNTYELSVGSYSIAEWIK